MSYSEAKRALDQNANFIDSQTNPAMWNLNAALRHLVEAIEDDMHQIQRHLTGLESVIMQRTQKPPR